MIQPSQNASQNAVQSPAQSPAQSPIQSPASKIAVLLHEGIQGRQGKTGLALVRFRPEAIAVVIDAQSAGGNWRELTGIPLDVPIVASVAEALAYDPNWLAIGIAPSGGVLPEPWMDEVTQAVAAGLSVMNGLHTRLADRPALQALLQPHQTLWDIRQEPPGLRVGSGAARGLKNRRVLTVGTDMSVGKMSTSLALHRAALAHGVRSQFLATGQAGVMIAGSGIPLDAIRVDFAAGAVEGLVMAADADLLHIEGQGSLLNPASTATLPLLRGSQPTALILVHRAGQTHIRNYPQVPIPRLDRVVAMYEAVAEAGGAFAPAPVVGIALNTAHLSQGEAQSAIAQAHDQTGLPCIDPVRYGPDLLLEAVLP
jgi:uncharacterized NAD-dependent epimerase/dehydratase family protein